MRFTDELVIEVHNTDLLRSKGPMPFDISMISNSAPFDQILVNQTFFDAAQHSRGRSDHTEFFCSFPK